MSNYSAEQCLQLVMRSPQAVSSHNKAAWMNIFARYNIVEDPVGSAPHVSGVYDAVSGQRGFGPLGRFYDNFIAPNQISFQVNKDIVCGLNVVRDLTIQIQMSAAVTVKVPMHLLYELTDQDGELKILRLAAHWELLPMLKQQLTNGKDSLGITCSAGLRMLKFFGVSGMLGFCRALRTIGQRGKLETERFSQLFNSVDKASLLQGLSDNKIQLLFDDGSQLSIEQLLAESSTLSFGKTLVAGNFVSVSCELSYQQQCYSGVAFFEFNLRSRKLLNVVFYLSKEN